MKTIARAIAAGFLLAATMSFYSFAAVCEQLPEGVIRLHVVAHSDSAEDQAVKLKVRDAVLAEAAQLYKNADTMEAANSALCLHLDSIRLAADKVLAEEGFSQRARVSVTQMYFNTTDYEGFSLPAGTYRTLRVTIGEGAGHNWWCVVFPALCLPAAEERREDVLSRLPDPVEHPEKYRVRFKTVELYEDLKNWFDQAF